MRLALLFIYQIRAWNRRRQLVRDGSVPKISGCENVPERATCRDNQGAPLTVSSRAMFASSALVTTQWSIPAGLTRARTARVRTERPRTSPHEPAPLILSFRNE